MMKPTPTCCPLCDNQAVETRFDLTKKYKYLGAVHVLEGLEHSVCTECGFDFFAKGQIERNNTRFYELEKRVVKAISPRQIRQIRETYLLSQEDADKAFNCGAGMFSKWERGTSAPTGTAALTLIRALEDVSFMKWLADRAGVHIDTGEEASDEVTKDVDSPQQVITTAIEFWLTQATEQPRGYVTHHIPKQAGPRKNPRATISASTQTYWAQFSAGTRSGYFSNEVRNDDISEPLISSAHFANYASHR